MHSNEIPGDCLDREMMFVSVFLVSSAVRNHKRQVHAYNEHSIESVLLVDVR